MAPDEYLRMVLAQYELPGGPDSPAAVAAQDLNQHIQQWAGRYLFKIDFCGSYANNTRVRGSTDADLLISLAARTPKTIDQIHDHFFQWLRQRGFNPRQESVSIGILHHGLAFDLIPAKLEPGESGDHMVFENDRRHALRTNFATHNRVTAEAGWQDEIKVVKIWRNMRELNFPSFCLELTVMDALRKHIHGHLAFNVERVLIYLRDILPGAPIRDPANFDNRVSDAMMKHEKIALSEAAAESLRQTDWALIVS